MSYGSSSPFTSPARPGRPGRDAGNTASFSGGTQDNPISFEDDDDDNDDCVLDSSPRSSPYFTQPTQVTNRPTMGIKATANTGTQPTQITNRPIVGLGSTRVESVPQSSSPRKIEVPRSSPFKSSPPSPAVTQAQRQRPFGGIHSLAPAGTSFKRPNFNGSSDAAAKKPTPFRRSVSASSDELNSTSQFQIRSDTSSSPERHAPADIERSSFVPRQIASVPPSIALTKEFEDKYGPSTQLKAKKLSKRFADRAKSTRHLLDCAEAIELKKGDMDAAYDWIVNHKSNGRTAPTAAPARSPPPPEPKRGRLISKGQMAKEPVSSKRSSISRSPSPVPAKRRRLVSKANLLNHSSAPVISLVDSDDDEVDVSNDKSDGDHYASESESESESEPELDATGTKRSTRKTEAPLVGMKRAAKILHYLNSCALEDLASNAKISKDNAKYLLTKRPFSSVAQLKAIHKFKTSGKRKTKIDLGEDVFESLSQYVKRLDIIDRIIGHCDAQGRLLKSKMAAWNMDQLGNMKTSATTIEVLPFPKEPELIESTLYPYQLFGMNWMLQLYNRGIGGILADDMGLGKTCQTIAFMALLVDLHKKGIIAEKPPPNLVVVPSSVFDNWSNEFAKFAPELSVLVYTGKPEERDELALEILETGQEYDVILTSYGQMSRPRDVNYMNKIGINAAIFDEGHKLKNPQTKLYKDLVRINAHWRMLITGTPIQNNIMEMMSLLSFVSPQFFTHNQEVIEELFSQKASMKEVSEGATLLNDRIQRAKSILDPFILQRKKDQVLSMLPPKVRKVIYCGMLPKQKAQWEATSTTIRKDMRREDADGKKATVKKRPEGGRGIDKNNLWLQLRKSATHPMLFRTHFTDEMCEEMAKILMKRIGPEELQQPSLKHMTDELKGYSDFELHLWCRDYRCIRSFDSPEGAELESGKIEKLFEIIEQCLENGDRLLVFSRFGMVLEILQECLSKRGVKYLKLTGLTNVGDRQNMVDEFQQDESITVFLLTTLAGGQGINLTAANKVVIFDQSDNPQHDVQAENRAHRMGQERAVDVIRLITKDTIDEMIYLACQKKLELAGQITGFSEDIGQKMETDVVAQVKKQFLDGDGVGLVTPPESDI